MYKCIDQYNADKYKYSIYKYIDMLIDLTNLIIS